MYLPSTAAKYLSLQRLETQALGNTIHYSGVGASLYEMYRRIPLARHLYRMYSIHIEPRFRSKAIIRKYEEIMIREFGTLRNHIGTNVSTVVSIGPGLAGLEVMLSHYINSIDDSYPEIILVDKSGIDPIHFGYHRHAAVYNSLELAKRILTANGHPAENVKAIDASSANCLLDTHAGTVDLITSLLAWGFHFPVDAYLPLAKELLNPSGRIIIDIRKATDGRQALAEEFNRIESIHDDPKFERLLVTEPT